MARPIEGFLSEAGDFYETQEQAVWQDARAAVASVVTKNITTHWSAIEFVEAWPEEVAALALAFKAHLATLPAIEQELDYAERHPTDDTGEQAEIVSAFSGDGWSSADTDLPEVSNVQSKNEPERNTDI